MTQVQMSEAKIERRKALRALRSTELIDAEERIVGKLARLLSGNAVNEAEKRLAEALNAVRIVGIYSPLLGEPDLRGIFCDWLDLGMPLNLRRSSFPAWDIQMRVIDSAMAVVFSTATLHVFVKLTGLHLFSAASHVMPALFRPRSSSLGMSRSIAF